MFNVYPTLSSLSAVDAPVIANTNIETSMFPLVNGLPGLPTFPGGSLGEGSTFTLATFGIVANRQNAPGTFTARAKLGSTTVWSSGNLALPSAVHTNITYMLDITFMVRAGSKVMVAGVLMSALTSSGVLMLPASTPTDSAALDLSQDLDLDLTAQWSVADPGNEIQMLGVQLVY